jgi:hypothetical protein
VFGQTIKGNNRLAVESTIGSDYKEDDVTVSYLDLLLHG